MLRLLVLGAAAGGGLPQWNCACEVCRCARLGQRGVVPQTQSSVAVTADGQSYFLLNASPDLRQQLAASPALHPRARRHSPIAGVVLTNGDVDHVAGLLTLRERQPFTLLATARVLETLAGNPIFNVLHDDCVVRRAAALGDAEVLTPVHCDGSDDGGCGRIEVKLLPVPGKVALYLEDPSVGPDFGTVDEDTVALEVRDPRTDERFFYIPGCAALTPELAEQLRGASLVLFDGTVWQDDEMISREVGEKTGGRMGHLAMAAQEGSIAAFAGLGVKRKVFIHINNTNPVWLKDSPERRAAEAAGWEIAYDGMEIEL